MSLKNEEEYYALRMRSLELAIDTLKSKPLSTANEHVELAEAYYNYLTGDLFRKA